MVKVCLQCRRPGFNPWVEKISWRRTWQPTPVFLPEKSHGWRSLVGYSPWGRKELDRTERLHFQSVDVQLHCFHLLAIVNNAIVNLGIQVYLFKGLFSTLG